MASAAMKIVANKKTALRNRIFFALSAARALQ